MSGEAAGAARGGGGEKKKKKKTLGTHNLAKVLKPSHGSLKIIVGRLGEDDSTAEAAAWTLWGLVSTWNPNWQQNQEHLQMLLDRDDIDVLHALSRLLLRAAPPVRLRALGALAQLPYLSGVFKRRAAGSPSLLSALASLLDEGGRDVTPGAPPGSYAGMQLQMRSARVLAALCSTPCAHPEVCDAMVEHGALLAAVERHAASAVGAFRHELIRIVFNLSFTRAGRAAIEPSRVVSSLLVPVLDGQSSGGSNEGAAEATRALWAICGVANLTGDRPNRTLLRPQEVLALVACLDASVHEEHFHVLDPSLRGVFGCVDVTEGHDATLRVYPFTALQPLATLAKAAGKRGVLEEAGLCPVLVLFLSRYHNDREHEIHDAVHKEIARQKVEASSGDTRVAKPEELYTPEGVMPQDQFGLPPMHTEHDVQEVRTMALGLEVVASMAAHALSRSVLQQEGAISSVRRFLRDRNPAIRIMAAHTLGELAGGDMISRNAKPAPPPHAPRAGAKAESSPQKDEPGNAATQDVTHEEEGEQAALDLVGMLKDKDSEVRVAAARALGKAFVPHRPAARVQKRILRTLLSSNADHRRAAVGALGGVGRREGVEREVGGREGSAFFKEGGVGWLIRQVVDFLGYSPTATIKEDASLGRDGKFSVKKGGAGLLGKKGGTEERRELFGGGGSPDVAPRRGRGKDTGGGGGGGGGKNAQDQVRVSAACALLEMGEVSAEVPRELARRLKHFHATHPFFRPPGEEQTGAWHEAVTDDDFFPLDLDAARLAVFILGHVARSRPATDVAMDVLAPLLRRGDMQGSALEKELPPHSRGQTSGAQDAVVKERTSTPHAAFQAVINISVAAQRPEEPRPQVVPDVLSRVQACVYLVHHPSCAIVRRGAADCLARITPLKDAAVIAALINLNFDPDKDVVASAMKAVTSIVAGRALPNGTLSTMGTILPLKNGSKRLLSPTRRLQPLPSRPVVTRQYLDEMLDSDGDGWHSYMYWSHSFHHGQAAVVDRALIVKAEVDRRGLPGWIYTRESLLDDLLEHDTQELHALGVQLERESEEALVAKHDKMVHSRDVTIAETRALQARDLRALEALQPLWTEDNTETEGGNVWETAEEVEGREAKKREKEIAHLTAASEHTSQLIGMEEDQAKTIKRLTREHEDQMARMELEMKDDGADLLEKKQAVLRARQEKRLQQGKDGIYGDLVWSVVAERVKEAETFVACLSSDFLSDPVCLQELEFAFSLGKKIVAVVMGSMPGMLDSPAPGVSHAGGNRWWPPQGLGSQLGSTPPVNLYLASGPSPIHSVVFAELYAILLEGVEGELRKLQAQVDGEHTAKINEARLRQTLFKQSRLDSRKEWMLQGSNG